MERPRQPGAGTHATVKSVKLPADAIVNRLWKLTTLVVLLGALAVALGGCDFEEEFYPALRPGLRPAGESASASREHRLDKGGEEEVAKAVAFLFYDFEDFLEGEFTPIGAHEAEVKDKIVSGPFNGMLGQAIGPFGRPGGGAVAAKSRGVRGTYIADLNGTTDSSTGTAHMTAIGALKFARKSQGIACFEMKASFTKGGTVGKGTFRSTGGTKASATSRLSGSFKDTVTTPKAGEKEDRGKLTGTAKLGKPAKAPPAACTALLTKLP